VQQEQPDREVKSRFNINLGTFVFPNTPFPYHFDVGEWVGVNGVNGAGVKENGKVEGVREGEDKRGKEREKETEKEKEVDKNMEVDAVEGKGVKEKNGEEEKEKGEEKGAEVGEVKEKDEAKEKEQEKEQEKDKVVETQKEKEKEKEKTGETPVTGKTSSQKEEVDDVLDFETRATILIPNGYIPHEKPLKPAVWGGGVIGRPSSPQRRASSNPDTKSDSPVRLRKRRIYTDDSDLFLCALHSGWITWSGSARARDKGQDLRVEVRIIRCAGAGAGSVYAVGAGGAHAGKYAPGVNGAVATNGAYHRKNGNGKNHLVRKEELVGRFIGGWGEKCFVKDEDAEMEDETENDEENDGRGLVSAGWGSGHDGSAIEVLHVEFVIVGTLLFIFLFSVAHFCRLVYTEGNSSCRSWPWKAKSLSTTS
jgi:hypothetical protein